MIATFLGTGTSSGVPAIGCRCAVCRSADPRNTRTRASALLRGGGTTLLVDSATELRLQCLRWGVDAVDAVLYTHPHADHLHGIDDLRCFSAQRREHLPVYGDAATMQFIRTHYAYIFNDARFTLGWGIPRLETRVLEGPARIGAFEVTPVPLRHGPHSILGYRVGGLAYLTDCSAIPEASYALLTGLDTLVLDALRPEPHPTHFSIAEALAEVERLAPRRAWFTHLAHEVDHAAVEKTLPPHVRLAYDGLEITWSDPS